MDTSFTLKILPSLLLPSQWQPTASPPKSSHGPVGLHAKRPLLASQMLSFWRTRRCTQVDLSVIRKNPNRLSSFLEAPCLGSFKTGLPTSTPLKPSTLSATTAAASIWVSLRPSRKLKLNLLKASRFSRLNTPIQRFKWLVTLLEEHYQRSRCQSFINSTEIKKLMPSTTSDLPVLVMMLTMTGSQNKTFPLNTVESPISKTQFLIYRHWDSRSTTHTSITKSTINPLRSPLWNAKKLKTWNVLMVWNSQSAFPIT